MVLRTKLPNPADGFEDETTKPPMLTRVRPPPSLTPSPSFLTWPSGLRQVPRRHRPPSWLDWRRLRHPCTLALVDVPDVSHRGWSPGLLVPRSKPHVRPSPLPLYRHDTSLLDLLLAVDHRLRAPHLHNTSQETCRIHSFRHGRVSHHSTYFVNHIDNHSSQNEHTKVLVNLVFAFIMVYSAISSFEVWISQFHVSPMSYNKISHIYTSKRAMRCT
jgi:hypothetical protein